MSKTTSKWALGLVALAILFALVSFLRENWNANEKPGFVESILAKWALGLGRSQASEARNPLPDTPENLAEGRRLYDKECALCHGRDGEGQGPAGPQFYPPAPALAGRASELPDGRVQAIIGNGIRYTAMASFAKELTPEEIWKVVLWVRHLPQQPTATPGNTPGSAGSAGASGGQR